MRIDQILLDATNQLVNVSQTPRLDAEILLAAVLNFSRVQLISELQAEFPANKHLEFLNYLQRRLQHEPIAYIIGQREFYGRQFIVDSSVLIPRPETELLVERIKSLGLSQTSKVLDLCTGSGCIGISIACEIGCGVLCSDISTAALEVAKQNALRHGVDHLVQFIKSDLFDQIDPQSFDAIVSNPPYLRADEVHNNPALSFEPASAFISENDGLADLQEIFLNASKWLNSNGVLLCEFGYRHENELSEMLSELVLQHGGSSQIFKDLAGIARVSEWKRTR